MENIFKYFRDLKKNEGISDEDKREIRGEGKFDPKVEFGNEKNKIEEKESLGEISKRFYHSLELVKAASLKPEFSKNQKESQILNMRKDVAIKTFSKILEDIKKYLSQVAILQVEKKESYEDLDQYQSVIEKSDGLRRIYHNALISDLKMLIKIININFNKDFPEELRLEEEAKAMDRKDLSREELKNLMSQREYYSFPNKRDIFFDLDNVRTDPLAERGYIANWALEMYEDLTALSEKIKEELKK